MADSIFVEGCIPSGVMERPAYWPATVAEHWADEVRKSIENDVKAGVLVKVPFNEPTVWCARMVLVKKKDGRPRRTVDYQQLNAQCLREPNYGESPFHTARRVPLNSWKSTFDAVDRYLSVELDEPSSKLNIYYAVGTLPVFAISPRPLLRRRCFQRSCSVYYCTYPSVSQNSGRHVHL